MEDPPNPIAKIKIKSKRTVNAFVWKRKRKRINVLIFLCICIEKLSKGTQETAGLLGECGGGN